jgi:isopenicillin N synthase-like dioxygenase
MPTSFAIPTIDLDRDDGEILPTLERALCDIGFVLVKGHGVPAELVSDLRQQLVDYFDRPLDDKMAERITPDNYRGYIPLGFFSPNTEGVTPDQYEGYKLHAEVTQDDPLCTACDLYGPNRWPREPAGLRETTEAFWQACEATGQRLLSLIAQIMKVDVADFLTHFDQPLTNMTLLHYPPSNPNEGFGIHPHKDTDALTLLFPDAVGGLWLRPHDQTEWLEVKAPDDTMVVNIGDLLELWSGGYFVSTPHKVVNTSGKERYSFPFFIVPRHDVVVAPLIDCQPGFERDPVPVGPVSREVWRTNWPEAVPEDTGFDLGTLPD